MSQRKADVLRNLFAGLFFIGLAASGLESYIPFTIAKLGGLPFPEYYNATMAQAWFIEYVTCMLGLLFLGVAFYKSVNKVVVTDSPSKS